MEIWLVRVWVGRNKNPVEEAFESEKAARFYLFRWASACWYEKMADDFDPVDLDQEEVIDYYFTRYQLRNKWFYNDHYRKHRATNEERMEIKSLKVLRMKDIEKEI